MFRYVHYNWDWDKSVLHPMKIKKKVYKIKYHFTIFTLCEIGERLYLHAIYTTRNATTRPASKTENGIFMMKMI